MKTISVTKVKQVLKSDYSEFKVKSIKPLKGGWDNFVFEINKGYIFRFPKKDEFNLNKEIEVLKYLKDKITLEIPNYEFVGKKIKYVGYKKIIGDSLTPEVILSLNKKESLALAKSIAVFFYEFHEALPIRLIKKFNLKKDGETWRPLIIRKYLLNTIKDSSLLAFIKLALKEYQILRRQELKFIIAFNDLHGDNIAYDRKNKNIVGVFDFSDVAVENIDREFSHLFSTSPSLSIEIINYYQKLSRRKINIKNVYLNSIILEASIMAAYNKKSKSDIYKKSLANLIRLKECPLSKKCCL
ncbi:MAG: phosphotransferase family protein [Patescibacteria group bacterium]